MAGLVWVRDALSGRLAPCHLPPGSQVREILPGSGSGSPWCDFYVRCNGRKIDADDELQDGLVYSVEPRLCGGKGGFGSMLRALGAQIEKTTNREACRDLSGRRLRDVNHEKAMAEWIKKQAEREEEKEQRRLERLKRKLAEPKHYFNDPEYSQQCSDMSERLEESVIKGLQASSSSVVSADSADSRKRRKEPLSGKAKSDKKKCLWLGVEGLEVSSSSGSDSDSESPSTSASSGNSVSGQDRSESDSDGSAQSATATGHHSTERSKTPPAAKTDQSETVSATPEMSPDPTETASAIIKEVTETPAAAETDQSTTVSATTEQIPYPMETANSIVKEVTKTPAAAETDQSATVSATAEQIPDPMETASSIITEVTETPAAAETDHSDSVSATTEQSPDPMETANSITNEVTSREGPTCSSGQTNENPDNPEPVKPADSTEPMEPAVFDLLAFSSATELEALGLEKLKVELTALGLKCGGTLQERAARLFSVRGLSREQIDPALFPKPSKGRKR